MIIASGASDFSGSPDGKHVQPRWWGFAEIVPQDRLSAQQFKEIKVLQMDVSKNNGPPKSSILMGFPQ